MNYLHHLNLNTFGQDTGHRGDLGRVENLFFIYLKHIPTVITVEWNNAIWQTDQAESGISLWALKKKKKKKAYTTQDLNNERDFQHN